MEKKKQITWLILLAVNVFILFWSANYLVSYSGKQQIGAEAYAIIFSVSLFCINKIVLEWLKK